MGVSSEGGVGRWEEAGRRLLSQWGASSSPGGECGHSLPAQAPEALSPTWAAGGRWWPSSGTARGNPGDRAQPHSLWPPLNTGNLQIGPLEEALLPGVAEDAWSPGSGRGGSRERQCHPRFLSTEPEGRSRCSRPSCAMRLGTRSATRREVGWPRLATSSSSPSQPGAHSRVSLPPIPRPSRPACRGVSADGGGASSNQSQAGNSSRGARHGTWQSSRAPLL